jgi:hypothetical protein
MDILFINNKYKEFKKGINYYLLRFNYINANLGGLIPSTNQYTGNKPK